MPPMPVPRNPAEWQKVTNLAHAMLLIHSAQCYGLITGDPGDICVERCEHLLQRAKARGYTPQEKAAVQMAVVFCQQGGDNVRG